MFNSHIRLYDVKFQISCLTAESAVFAVLAMCPEIEDFVFERKGITDNEWRKIEHIMGSCSVNLVHAEKIPHVPEEDEEEEEEDEDLILENAEPNQRPALLFDELMARREMIYETANDKKKSAEEKEDDMLKHARDFSLTSQAILDEIKKQVIEELLNGTDKKAD